jgi:predicted GIY-YIG superfamily endonuclease
MTGIYLIKNLDSHQIFVGFSTNIPKRISDHKVMLRKNAHHNKELQSHWNRGDKFEFAIYKECEKDEGIKIKKTLLKHNPHTYHNDRRSNFDKVNVEKFWRHVHIGHTDECWLWQGALDSQGYGKYIAYKNNMSYNLKPHRISYYIRYKEDISQFTIRHACSNKHCVNPAHLFRCI